MVPGAKDNIIGVEGKIIPVEFTNEMRVEIGPLSLDQPFARNPHYRDLLCKRGASIKCSPNRLTLDIPIRHMHYLATLFSSKEGTLHSDLKDLPPSL